MKTSLFFLLPAFASAFTDMVSSPVVKPIIRGSTPPIENFDPLQFSKDESRLTFYREAELKHGRAGMVAATVIPISEMVTHEQGIHQFDHLPTPVKIMIIGSMFMSEFNTMLKGWENPNNKLFALLPTYQPGDFGFNLSDDINSEEYGVLMDKELNNGRLAMIASLGMIAQELVTGKTLF